MTKASILIRDKHGIEIDLVDQRPRREIINELTIRKDEAAARLGITVQQFVALVKEGIFPSPIPGTRKWHRKKLYESIEIRKIRTHKVDPGWVYFMEMGDFIKIGWSTWPETRREALQIGNPYDIIILCAVPGSIENEGGIHNLFSHLRSRGEWFRKSPGLLAYIAWLKVVWRGDSRLIRGDLDNVVPIGKSVE